MTVFLENLPPTLQVIIASRADLPLSIARWHVQGQVVEMRAADLRFSLAETALFLNDLMHLNLTSADVSALEARTEGWVGSLGVLAYPPQKKLVLGHMSQVKDFECLSSPNLPLGEANSVDIDDNRLRKPYSA
jgi:ATP/maltotriose-dependent transcriptional regulator MalT